MLHRQVGSGKNTVKKTTGKPLSCSLANAANFGDKLFDLAADFKQEYELQTFELEARIANLLVRAMKENDSPQEQFARLGLPMERTIIAEDIRKMHQRADRLPPRNPDR